MDLAEHLAEYKEQGFTVFPALHSAEWVAEVSCDARARLPAAGRSHMWELRSNDARAQRPVLL